MALVLSEEQRLLQRTAREFVTGRSSMKRIRELRDRADLGFSPELWREMAALGWAGIVLPEQYGGIGLGYADLMVVMEELGRGLMPEPMLSTVLLGANTLLLGGTDAQKKAHLSKVAAGEALLALAQQEPRSRYELAHVETRAERAGDGYRLSGEKVQVLDGAAADHLIVSARTSGGLRDAAGVTLFLLSRDAAGLGVEPQRRVDARGAALVHLDGVVAKPEAIVGEVGEGAVLLQRVIDRATIALTAEMLGAMTVAFEMTLDYLKTRQQFGKPIGSFQALKHRAARLYVELELARSLVMAAHEAIDAGKTDAEIARLASATKARLSDAFVLIANEAIQMHGGIGMTDEHDIGFFLKRARASEIQFGDAAFHRARVAALEGY
ncbi:MAG TPA: acyl-CoA dehydrogenase [Candidatus Limnocylindria bacterium]|nr:acyl-CoA dehydrogenase [Candidatus Limnocylindria bacterium]